MLFDQNIKQPSHEKIVLRGARAEVQRLRDIESGEVISEGIMVKNGTRDLVLLDENDAIRLGAFLVRWYRERNRAELAAEAARIKASREAKKARYAERKKDKA